MITDFIRLMSLCEDELNNREYAVIYQGKIKEEWENLTNWMKLHTHVEFSESIGFQYCDETLGTHILVDNLMQSEKIKLRAIRMLISYQKDGDFEFRAPRVDVDFHTI